MQLDQKNPVKSDFPEKKQILPQFIPFDTCGESDFQCFTGMLKSSFAPQENTIQLSPSKEWAQPLENYYLSLSVLTSTVSCFYCDVIRFENSKNSFVYKPE